MFCTPLQEPTGLSYSILLGILPRTDRPWIAHSASVKRKMLLFIDWSWHPQWRRKCTKSRYVTMLPQHCSSEYFLPITTQILYAAQNSHFAQWESVFRSIWSTTFLSYLLSCLSIHATMLSFSPSCIFLFALSQSLFSITLSIYISLCLSLCLSLPINLTIPLSLPWSLFWFSLTLNLFYSIPLS